ncbi:hypothetical protein [Microvirga puerhi]|uniref:Uncharacterized protein n=1 Tax=Microvirga puerhi TaxID=2876078 RepID=A0ABS7VJG5_9HYPH|nr:hypothetical protein [Microvirga puerhi]MBZ6075658.1 hypothetical protein [Microvirga puerhi]
MSTSKRNERRLLNDEEYTLVEQTRHPVLGKLEEAALKDLTQRLRERRDRARDIASRQRREVRGKGRQTTTFEKKDAGNRHKAGVLAEALTRINGEHARRKADELRTNARRALALRQEAPKAARPKSGRTPREGMAKKPNTRREKIGNPMDAGRISQAGKSAQAKRDKG